MTNDHPCFHTPPILKSEALAIKALSQGKADEHQQVLALAVIIKKLARAYDVHFTPGEPDASAFLAGRGFVGQKLTKYINVSINDLEVVNDDNPDE